MLFKQGYYQFSNTKMHFYDTVSKKCFLETKLMVLTESTQCCVYTISQLQRCNGTYSMYTIINALYPFSGAAREAGRHAPGLALALPLLPPGDVAHGLACLLATDHQPTQYAL